MEGGEVSPELQPPQAAAARREGVPGAAAAPTGPLPVPSPSRQGCPAPAPAPAPAAMIFPSGSGNPGGSSNCRTPYRKQVSGDRDAAGWLALGARVLQRAAASSRTPRSSEASGGAVTLFRKEAASEKGSGR